MRRRPRHHHPEALIGSSLWLMFFESEGQYLGIESVGRTSPGQILLLKLLEIGYVTVVSYGYGTVGGLKGRGCALTPPLVSSLEYLTCPMPDCGQAGHGFLCQSDIDKPPFLTVVMEPLRNTAMPADSCPRCCIIFKALWI